MACVGLLASNVAAASDLAEIPIGFKTHHPQGMVKIGDAFFVSSVEITVPTNPTTTSPRSLSMRRL
jgi:Family of unknown function (DUF6454)